MTEPTEPKVLAEASATSLDELFNRDPEGYNDQDVDKIVDALRTHRERIAAAGGQPGKVVKSAPKAPTGAPRIAAPGGKVSLKDLGLMD